MPSKAPLTRDLLRNRVVRLSKPSRFEHAEVRLSYRALATSFTIKLINQDVPHRYQVRHVSSMARSQRSPRALGQAICYSQLVGERKSWLAMKLHPTRLKQYIRYELRGQKMAEILSSENGKRVLRQCQEMLVKPANADGYSRHLVLQRFATELDVFDYELEDLLKRLADEEPQKA